MPLIELPQELTDMVIDHLHDDKPSLLACSLVNKYWLPSARYHLFYTTHLDHWHDHPDWPDLATNLELFLLEGQAAWIYVQHLHVRFLNKALPSFLDNNTRLRAEPPRNLFRAIIQSLPKLHTLVFKRLGNTSHRFFGGDDRDVIYEPRVRLRKLVLWDLEKEQVIFWLHLRAFASIGELHILATGSQYHVDPPSRLDSSNFPRIESLVGATNIPFMAMIPLSCVESSLTSLSIHFDILAMVGDSTGYLRALLPQTAPNLKFLRLDFGDLNMKPDTRPMDHLDISSCVSLQSIAFCLYSGSWHATNESEVSIHWSTLLRLLRQAPSPIQSILITLPLYDGAEDAFSAKAKTEFEWDQLDLQLMSFKDLREVRVMSERRMHDLERWRPSWELQFPLLEPWRDELEPLLPMMGKTGRMKFS